MPAQITSFKGAHRWLSNFWPAAVRLDGIRYTSVEHAYQAAKNTDQLYRLNIWHAPTPAAAKKLGKTATLRDDWDAVKLSVMHDLLTQKFAYLDLRLLLLATGDAELIEGNNWGDTFWGVCKGVGQNHLGKLLMRVRSEIPPLY